MMEKLETVFKALESPGRAGPNMNPCVLSEEFKPWVDSELYSKLVEYVTFGVNTRTPKPTATTTAKASKAARDNTQSVWRHLRTFSAQGWIHVLSPACRKAIHAWCIHVCMNVCM